MDSRASEKRCVSCPSSSGGNSLQKDSKHIIHISRYLQEDSSGIGVEDPRLGFGLVSKPAVFLTALEYWRTFPVTPKRASTRRFLFVIVLYFSSTNARARSSSLHHSPTQSGVLARVVVVPCPVHPNRATQTEPNCALRISQSE